MDPTATESQGEPKAWRERSSTGSSRRSHHLRQTSNDQSRCSSLGRPRCSCPRSIRSLSAPAPVTGSQTRMRSISCVSCRPLTRRRSRKTWCHLPTTNSARRSRPKRCLSWCPCSVAQRRRVSAWRSAPLVPAPTRMWFPPRSLHSFRSRCRLPRVVRVIFYAIYYHGLRAC